MNVQFSKNGQSYMFQVDPNGMFAEVALQFLTNLNIQDPNIKFYLNGKKLGLEDGKSFIENNIYNGAIIEVTTGNPQMTGNFPTQNQNQYQNKQAFSGIPQNIPNNQVNLNFILSGGSRRIIVQGQLTNKFEEIVQRFKTKAALEPNAIPKFIYNSMQIPPNEQRTLSELKLRDQSRIEVFIESEVIGA